MIGVGLRGVKEWKLQLWPETPANKAKKWHGKFDSWPAEVRDAQKDLCYVHRVR
jgi:hypothetical protein